MSRSMCILVVGSLSSHTPQLETILRNAGYDPTWKSGPPESIGGEPYDLVVADADAEPSDCASLVRMLRDGGCDLPLLILSDDATEEQAVAAIKAGADEWVEKTRIEAQFADAVARGATAAERRRAARRVAEENAAEAEVSQGLARVALELVAAWGSRMLFERIGQVSAELLSCDFASTLMLEPGGDAFEVVASHGWTAEGQEVGRLVRVPVEMMGTVLETLAGEEVVDFKTKPMSTIFPVHGQISHLVTALRRDSTIIGVQIFSRGVGAKPFTAIERRVAAGITELASLSLKSAQAIDGLERAHRVKSDFVATVSHELRTPLHIVMGYTDLLLEGAFGTFNEEQLQALQRIRQRAQGLLELINATLDLNRLEAGHISVDFEPTDLSELMATIRREIVESHHNPDLRLIWEVPDGLPIVRTDPGKLKVALKNLISNAVKFTDQGSVTIRVRAPEQEIEFSVTDTGVGISPEALPIVFEAFRQADSSSTRRFGGVGLGLYIVRRLLDLLGGKVDVQSQLGRGSTFWIRLPRETVGAKP